MSKNTVARFFLFRYENESYVLETRARVFMYCCFSLVIILIPLIIIVPIYLSHILVQTYAVVFTVIFTLMICLILLRKGRYYAASNLMASVLALVFITGLMAKLYKDPHLGYASYTYHMLGAIVLTSVFCKSRMLFIITAILLAANAAFFTLVKDMLDPLSLQAAKSGLACSCLMMIIICVLCYLVTYITQSAIKVSLRETKKSEERAELIQKLLDSVREAAEHLVASSGDLSGTASSFSENSQSQASSAEEIMATIEEVSAGVENIDAGAREQYDRLDMLIRKMNELSGTIREMGGKFGETQSIVSSVADRAKAGGALLESMDDGMKKIGASSGEMTGIVEIINSISDQINLLSLNAAIEAARAGDAGRGFAVVADAISKLADQTATSIKDIDGLIRANTEEIERGISNARTTIETISGIIEGVESINRMNEEISKIMNRQQEINTAVGAEAEKVKVRAEEIKSATDEQKKAVNEIVSSIAHVNEITQSNAVGAEKMLSSAKNFADIAGSLRSRFDSMQS